MSAGSNNYRRGIRAAVRGCWGGVLDYYEFTDAMMVTIRSGIILAWIEGAAECGVSEGELTQEEKTARDVAIQREFGYVDRFATYVEMHSKAKGGKLGPLHSRAEAWINRYLDVVNRAKLMACGNRKMTWVLGATKEHCKDCSRLNGRVYRGSVWEKWNVRPQHPALACGGYRCLCDLVLTDAPATPGRPPKLSGQF